MTSIILGTLSMDKMAGGLEKNIALLANHLARSGHKVGLVTFDSPGATSFFELDSSVAWHKVGRTKPHSAIGFWDRLGLISRIRSVIKQAGNPIVVCFHHGILPRFYLAAFMLGLRLVCSERSSITLYSYIRQAKWSLGFIMLGLADRITVQFKGYADDYPVWLRGRIRVIHNPVYAPLDLANPPVSSLGGRFKLLTVGRLCAQKNQKALIDAFASVCLEFPEWDLHIVGEGELADELVVHIKNSNLVGRVFLEGKQKNISDWLANSHLFCMPSR